MTLVAQLAKARSEGRLEERLLHYGKPKLQIVDELGYLPFEPEAAHLFFQLVSRRYEARSWFPRTAPSAKWGNVSGDPVDRSPPSGPGSLLVVVSAPSLDFSARGSIHLASRPAAS